MRVRAIILGNELEDHELWVKACLAHREQIDFRIVNLTSDSWQEEIQSEPSDILLAKPGGLTSRFKQIYDERIFILHNVLGMKIYPSPEEIYIYENKRFLSSWLKANSIPHPETHVFYNLKEAEKYIQKITFPIVGKTNIGASGSGVKILHTREEGQEYLKRSFSPAGAPRRSGPDTSKGNWISRVFRYIIHPADIGKRLRIYRTIKENVQSGYVILQEFIPHNFEWRVVRIGDSFFAHKKLKSGDKASGSLIKGYENPPFTILDFVKEITDKHNFKSQAVDIFESGRGYLINEMQCIFGQSDPHQMFVDGIPGRYRHDGHNWTFEAGSFTGNECYDLRLDYVISPFKKL